MGDNFLMMLNDIEDQIVVLLKTHLDLNFTLYKFSELQGRELLDLFNTVVYSIDNTQLEKIGTEQIDRTCDRLSEFLRVMKYPFPVEPEEWDVRFKKGDPKLIRPAMLWLLRDFDEMKQRAYLARYSEEIPVPDEIKAEESVTQMLSQHNELREKFMEVYKEYESLGSTDVDELKAQISSMESDKAKLTTKVQSFKRKLQGTKNLDQLLYWVTKLRTENERDLNLSEQAQRLNDEKRLLIHRQQVATDRIRNMKSHMEQRLQSLQQELASLKSTPTSGAGQSKDEKNIIVCQNQVLAASKRYQSRQNELKELQAKREALEQVIQEKSSIATIEMPSQAQYQQYVRKLKVINENYKTRQAEYSAMQRELSILKRTEDIVIQQEQDVHDEVVRVAQAKGVYGYGKAREDMAAVSSAKAQIDEEKSRTLEEMTQIVKEIQQKIAERHTELKPIVAELQEYRKQKQSVESRYIQQKQRYQNAIAEYDAECMALDEECKKLRGDLATFQSKYHLATQQINSTLRLLKRAQDESKAMETGNPISRDIKSYSAFFQKQSRAIRKETKALKEQKKSVGQTEDVNRKQLEAFQNLRRLLQVKQVCAQREAEAKIKKQISEQMETKGESLTISTEML